MYLFVGFAILGYIVLGLMISTGEGERDLLIGLLMIIMFPPYVVAVFKCGRSVRLFGRHFWYRFYLIFGSCYMTYKKVM